MATVREGNQGVLLVMDVQVGVVADLWQAPRIIANIAHAVERARALAVPVIWVQHRNKVLAPDSPAWQWVPTLGPAAGEALIHKTHNSAFEGSTLEATLAKAGATHIVLAGVQTNWCLRATAYAALERGYDLTLIEDGHTTDTMVLAGDEQIEAEKVVRELNIAITWLDYPGRVNGIAPAQRVDFNRPGGERPA